MGAHEMIDWQRLEQLRSDVGDAGFPTLVTMFLDEIGAAITATITAVTSDPAAVRALRLRALSALARSIGLRELARLCTDIGLTGQSGTDLSQGRMLAHCLADSRRILLCNIGRLEP